MARESNPDPIHLRPHAPIAERVLLPGDPGRAMRLAHSLLEAPKMTNHHRGLWGYTGTAADGEPLTVQSTGMGGPSAAIVVHELIELGARRIVRVGTCGALVPLDLGSLVVATGAIGADGASAAIGVGGSVDPALLAGLRTAAGEEAATGLVVSTDLFYDTVDRIGEWAAVGALAVEMEVAALLAVAAQHDVAAAAVLVVTDQLADGARVRISDEALTAAELELGRVGYAALV